jgi:succinate dehydrogenase/fumarate reductase flavoprotein subunit
VIDRLARNAIDLTTMPVEVAPIAHYHMGGIAADARMETGIPGLLAAGEAVGGANGANRLSGNAVTEALVFGRRAGKSAAARAARMTAQPFRRDDARDILYLVTADGAADGPNSAAMINALQAVMTEDVGALRTQAGLTRAIARIDEIGGALGERPFGGGGRGGGRDGGGAGVFDMERIDWFDLRNMVLVARMVAQAALRRTESRGAHQREDFPGMVPQWRVNQVARLSGGAIEIASVPVAGAKVGATSAAR